MIKKTKYSIIITCDSPDCDSKEEMFITDMASFKETIREEGWHLKAHGKCYCMDCWEEQKK